jgi:hypothetical protein
MILLIRLAGLGRALLAATAGPATASPELWCRPATILVLRNPALAPSCLSGWR